MYYVLTPAWPHQVRRSGMSYETRAKLDALHARLVASSAMKKDRPVLAVRPLADDAIMQTSQITHYPKLTAVFKHLRSRILRVNPSDGALNTGFIRLDPPSRGF